MLVFAGILLSATFCFVVSASVVMTKKELREFDGTKPGKGIKTIMVAKNRLNSGQKRPLPCRPGGGL